MKYRILVADDEGIMLESLKKIFEANFKEECELAFAKTGRAVIETAENFRPDIIFMDIQMPGINGIQAMQEIRRSNHNVIFVVLSAYDKFSYAQEAVNLGVMEYLTKPVNRKVIVEVAKKAMEKVEKVRKKRQDELEIREKLETVVPMIESGFIYNILLYDDFLPPGGNYKELLNIVEEYGYIMVVEFGDSFENGMMTNAVGSSVKAGGFYQKFREIVKGFMDCIVGPVMGNRIILFSSYKAEAMNYEERVLLITKVRSMLHKLEQRIESKFHIGIGDVHTMEVIKESYQEAVRALSENSRVVHIKDVSVEKGYDREYPASIEKRYIQMALRADLSGAISTANEFFDWMLENYRDYREDIEIKVLEIIMRLEYQALLRGKAKYGFRYRKNYIRDIQKCADYLGLREWFLNKTRDVCSNLAKVRERGSDSIIERAKFYISQNFQRDISLDDVSRKVDISPYYFSKLFKQEEGQNFIEYLTVTRICHAKELLVRPEYSIKEICKSSGYSDPNYFSRIFKKYEGVTPSEYRERAGI